MDPSGVMNIVIIWIHAADFFCRNFYDCPILLNGASRNQCTCYRMNPNVQKTFAEISPRNTQHLECTQSLLWGHTNSICLRFGMEAHRDFPTFSRLKKPTWHVPSHVILQRYSLVVRLLNIQCLMEAPYGGTAYLQVLQLCHANTL